MRNRYLIIGALFLALIGTSCSFKEDEKFATKTPAAGDIVFSIPTNSLPSPATGQSQLSQPDNNVSSGNFSITDDLTMTIKLSSVFTNLTVNTLNTNGAAETKATFNNVSGSVDWTYPVNTLGIGNKAPTPSTTTPTILQFVASNNDNSISTTRVFSVFVQDPLTVPSTNPTTAYADSTISLSYTFPVPGIALPPTVQLFVKRGKNSPESLALTNTKTYTDLSKSITDKFAYVMPDENPSGALDTLYFRFLATFSNGRTVTKTTNVANNASTVRFINVPFSKTTSGIGLFNSAITTADTTHTAYDFGKLGYVAKYLPGTTKDITLLVSGTNIGIASGSGNATTFVKGTSTLYSSPTFQTVRNAYLAGTPASSIANVYVNDIYIVNIDGNTKSAQYGILKVTAVNLTAAGTTDSIVIEFKSK